MSTPATKPPVPRLQIQSAARVSSPYVRVFVAGTEDTGKTMGGVTAPDPIWLLAETEREESLRQELIENAFPPPADAAILAWMAQQNPSVKPEELQAALKTDRFSILKEMTGVTYQMPMLDISDATKLSAAIEVLKENKFQTGIVDSLSALSKILLEYKKLCGGKGGKPILHGQQAYLKSGEATLDFVRDMNKLPMNFIYIGRGQERPVNVNPDPDGEPVWVTGFEPIFEGNLVRKGLPFLINHIFQSKRSGKDDKGRPKFVLKTRKVNSFDYERTLCLQLADEEKPDWTAIFKKILNK